MKCQACGCEFDERSVYCPECGEKGVNTSADAAEESAPETAAEPVEEAKQENDPPTISDRLREVAQGRDSEKKDKEKEKGGDEKKPLAWTEGGYCGKAMRLQFLGALLLTVPFVALGAWLASKEWMPSGTWGAVVWCVLLAVPVAYWVYLWCVYIYRVWTIKYRLTEHRFYHEQGLISKKRDIIEVIDIDDMQFEQSIFDKYINGGVGTVVLVSADSTDPELRMYGLADPEKVFDAIDESRRRQRLERGLKSI